MKNNNGKLKFSEVVFLLQILFVFGLVIFAAIFFLYKLGWAGFVVAAIFGLLFLPLLFSPALKSSRRKNGDENYFLNPIYKGWLGNIFTKK